MLVYRRVLSPRTMEVEKESLSPPRGFTHSFCLKESWVHMWVFPKIEVPQNGWFIMENPIKMGWLGGTTIFGNTYVKIVVELVLSNQKTANVLWSSISKSHSLDSVKYIEYIYIYTARVFSSCHPLQGHHDSGWVFKLKCFWFLPLILGVSWSNFTVAYFSKGLKLNHQLEFHCCSCPKNHHFKAPLFFPFGRFRNLRFKGDKEFFSLFIKVLDVQLGLFFPSFLGALETCQRQSQCFPQKSTKK